VVRHGRTQRLAVEPVRHSDRQARSGRGATVPGPDRLIANGGDLAARRWQRRHPRRATGCCSAQPALTASSARSGGEHGMRAVVRAGAQVGELPPDQERLLRPGSQGVIKPAGPGPHGDAALALPHSRQGEHPRGQPAPQGGVRGLLVQLGVRVGRRAGGSGAGSNGQAHRHGSGRSGGARLSTGDPLARRGRCRTSCSDGYARSADQRVTRPNRRSAYSITVPRRPPDRDYGRVGAVILGEALDHNEPRNAVFVRTRPVVTPAGLAEVTCPRPARIGGRAYRPPSRRITVSSAGHGGPSRRARRSSRAARCPFGSWSSGSQRDAATIARTRIRHSRSRS